MLLTGWSAFLVGQGGVAGANRAAAAVVLRDRVVSQLLSSGGGVRTRARKQRESTENRKVLDDPRLRSDYHG